MHSRRAAAVGIVFIVIAAFYFLFPTAIDPTHVDYAGFTMLVALGASMSIMAYVLFAGAKRS
jgi:drug/metabolite transporter superfamily protein YnfA